MSIQNNITTIAQRLRKAAETGNVCDPIRDIIGIEDITAAYEAQAINTNLRVQAGAKRIGSKIGLTSVAIQTQLGVDQPDFGILFNDMEVLNGGQVPWNELMQPRIEAEIAFVLGKDLRSAQIGTTDILSSIDYAVGALEIVGSRIANWDIKITDTIADNASASHFVLGHKPMRLENFDVVNCRMVMEVNGQKISDGIGAACLGSPVNATLWLAQKMADLGQPLKAGDIILTGAVGPMAKVNPGDEVKAIFEDLGTVAVTFGK